MQEALTGQLRFLTSQGSDVRQRSRLKPELLRFVDVGHIHTFKASLQLQALKPAAAPPQLTSRMQFQIKIAEDCCIPTEFL